MTQTREPKSIKCEGCNGTGKVSKCRHESQDITCGNCRCSECDGQGRVEVVGYVKVSR